MTRNSRMAVSLSEPPHCQASVLPAQSPPATFPQLAKYVLGCWNPSPFGFITKIKRVTAERGVRWGPAEPRCPGQAVGERPAYEQPAASRRRSPSRSRTA